MHCNYIFVDDAFHCFSPPSWRLKTINHKVDDTQAFDLCSNGSRRGFYAAAITEAVKDLFQDVLKLERKKDLTRYHPPVPALKCG